MFCYQRNFGLPTAIVTLPVFNSLVDSAQTRWLTHEHRRLREALEGSGAAAQTSPAPSILGGERDALLAQWVQDTEFQKFCASQEANRKKAAGGKTKGEAFKALTLEKKLQTYCDSLKKSLPFVIFIATYAETLSGKTQKLGCWRKQAACRLNGLCVIDFDHVTHPQLLPNGRGAEKTVREIWDEAYARLSEEDKKRILLVYVTPSGHGLKVVFVADAAVGNLIDNQKVFSQKLGLNPDEACKDASRGAFLTTREDIILIDEERLFTYENEEFGEKYNEAYHQGKSQPTAQRVTPSDSPCRGRMDSSMLSDCTPPNSGGEMITYNDVPLSKIVEVWMEGVNLDNNRHNTLTELASHLRYLIGKNPKKITEVVMSLTWVQDLAAEGEDVAGTVSSVMGWRYYEKKPTKLVEALKKVGADVQTTPAPPNLGGEKDSDIYALLPLDKWAEELQEMAKEYPCMKELFLNVHPHKLPAILFSSAVLFGTLMTKAYYHFWYEPEVVRRLNYCIFIIGDPGAGKNVIEKFYFKIAAPMIQADQYLIDAVNRYKDDRTERTTSTKAQKEEALKKPVVGIRVHPARTATGEFIRHMLAAVETVQGQPMNLHMFSFDSELDNVTKKQ